LVDRPFQWKAVGGFFFFLIKVFVCWLTSSMELVKHIFVQLVLGDHCLNDWNSFFYLFSTHFSLDFQAQQVFFRMKETRDLGLSSVYVGVEAKSF
jgi:hypothetical protein